MEREIANIAAACAMRGFRYLAFPPIVFDAPLEPLPEAEPEAEAVEESLACTPLEPEPPLAADELPMIAPTPVAQTPVAQTPDAPSPAPAVRAGRRRPAAPEPAEPSAMPRPASAPTARPRQAAPPPARRHFALLDDVSDEIQRKVGP